MRFTDGVPIQRVARLQDQELCVVLLLSEQSSDVFEVWHGSCRPIVYSVEPDLRTPDLRVTCEICDDLLHGGKFLGMLKMASSKSS